MAKTISSLFGFDKFKFIYFKTLFIKIHQLFGSKKLNLEGKKNILIVGRFSEWDSLAKHTNFFLDAVNYDTMNVYLYMEGENKIFQVDASKKLTEVLSLDIYLLDASAFDILIYTSPLTHNALTGVSWQDPTYTIQAFPYKWGKLNFAYCVWDGTVAHMKWVEIINRYFDAVFVPMSHLAEAMVSSGVLKPVFKLLNSFDYGIFLTTPHHPVNTPFVFGWNGTLEDRKNVFKLVSAFIKAFAHNPNVCLHLHMRYNVTSHNDKKYIDFINLINKHNNIFFDNTCLSCADNINLMKSYDAYIYPSMAEGYSVTPREALAAGHALILSDIATHKTITNLKEDAGVFWVAATHPVIINQLDLDLGFMYDIDENELSQAMKKLYSHRHNIYSKENIEKRKKSAKLYDASNVSVYFKTVLSPALLELSDKNKIGSNIIYTDSKELFQKIYRYRSSI